jgi:hypothetical protein
MVSSNTAASAKLNKRLPNVVMTNPLWQTLADDSSYRQPIFVAVSVIFDDELHSIDLKTRVSLILA